MINTDPPDDLTEEEQEAWDAAIQALDGQQQQIIEKQQRLIQLQQQRIDYLEDELERYRTYVQSSR